MSGLKAAALATAASLADWWLVGTAPEPLLWLLLFAVGWFAFANHPMLNGRGL